MLPRASTQLRTLVAPALISRHFPRLVCSRLTSITGTTRSLATVSDNTSLDDKTPSAIAQRLPDPSTINGKHRFREFELNDKVFIVTGGAQGLGLALAEALVEAGGHVYCLDIKPSPEQNFHDTKRRLAPQYDGTLHYRQVDVTNHTHLDAVITAIATTHSRLDGLIAAAAIQQVQPSLTYPPADIPRMLNINYTGVFLSATLAAKQMIKHHTRHASIVLIGSMSGLIANKGLNCAVYNSSKAAVIQLGRNLAMEFAHVVDGGPIRVNVLCPGNIITPMVLQNLKDDPSLKGLWERENMLGRLSEPEEYRGAALFMLSKASSFMTGSHLVIDGGYTAW